MATIRKRGSKWQVQIKADQVLALRKQGKGASEIASTLGIGRASVYRVLQQSG